MIYTISIIKKNARCITETHKISGLFKMLILEQASLAYVEILLSFLSFLLPLFSPSTFFYNRDVLKISVLCLLY